MSDDNVEHLELARIRKTMAGAEQRAHRILSLLDAVAAEFNAIGADEFAYSWAGWAFEAKKESQIEPAGDANG